MSDIETTVLSADYSKAVKLNQHIKVHAELAQQSLYEMCKGLKEMCDGKLYKELNYKNFEEYCEKEIGIKKVQAYKFVAIATNLSSDFVQSTEQIGTEKLSLLAKLDEPQREEIVQNTDLESVTVKELKKKIKSLEFQINFDKHNKELWQEDIKEINKLNEEIQKLENENYALENQVKELESRPVEVAFEKDMEEVENLLFQLERERKAHREEITRIKADKSKDNAILSEIEAYKKVAKNSLHNLYTAILRQETFSREHLGFKVLELLEEYIELFKFKDDEKDI